MQVETQIQINEDVKIVMRDIVEKVENFYAMQQKLHMQLSEELVKDRMILFVNDENLSSLLEKQKQYKGLSDQESEWSDSNEGEEIQKPTKMIEMAQYLQQSDGEDQNEDPLEKFRTQNEKQQEELLQKALQIQQETQEQREARFGVYFKGGEKLVNIGKVVSVMKDEIVVEGLSEIVIDLDNIIFTEEMQIVGTVEDVFGNVNSPHYLIHIDQFLHKLIYQRDLVQRGIQLFTIEGFSQILIQHHIENLIQKKGCDASNRYDQEIVNETEMEFSDDENQSQLKSKHNNKQRKVKTQQLQKEVDDELIQVDGEQIETENKKNMDGQEVVEIIKNNSTDQNSEKQGKKQKSVQQQPISQKKQILLIQNQNGVMKKMYVQPSQLEQILENPNAKVSKISNEEQNQLLLQCDSFQNNQFNNNNNFNKQNINQNPFNQNLQFQGPHSNQPQFNNQFNGPSQNHNMSNNQYVNQYNSHNNNYQGLQNFNNNNNNNFNYNNQNQFNRNNQFVQNSTNQGLFNQNNFYNQNNRNNFNNTNINSINNNNFSLQNNSNVQSNFPLNQQLNNDQTSQNKFLFPNLIDFTKENSSALSWQMIMSNCNMLSQLQKKPN